MRARRAMAVVVLAVAMPVGGAGQGGPRPKACGEVAYRSVGATATATTFSAMGVVDVEIEVTLTAGQGGLPGNFHGPHELGVRVLTPGGKLYQELTVPFTSDTVAAGATREVQGYPRPLKVQGGGAQQRAGGNKKQVKVTAVLPVGGTAISTSGLYGTWKIEVMVDGAQYDCVQKRTFTITQ